MRAKFIIGTTLAALMAASVHAAVPPITADGLVLVVNRQQPAGRALAERYAELRHVPADRIVEIDVPDDLEITPEQFDQSIADVVRHEIDARHLRDKVQCLVTFYGVPLRERDREVSAFDQNEVKAILDPSVNALRAQFKRSVEAVEKIAIEIDPSFKPNVYDTNTEQLRLRGTAAENIVNSAMDKMDVGAKAMTSARLVNAQQLLSQMPDIPATPTTKPTVVLTQAEVNDLLARPDDPEARRKLRDAAWMSGNVFQMLSVVESQQRSLQGGEGEASVDSELSCLWLGKYPKQKWVANPWHWGASPAQVTQLQPKTIRVARIDGPTPEIAKRVFEEAVATEERGLSGDAVLDARGMTGTGAIGSYDACDQSIRNTARYLTSESGLKPIFDNNPGLLPDHSSDHAAIYCGWYSVHNYKPTAKFIPGSIAWHVASYEMVSLRSPLEKGWCRGLLLDGADVTLGPVGEPYLIAFPPPSEFLGALMTGQTNVAEAYWATIPVTSWKMVLIGDPLYRPFAKHPAVTIDQLPPTLGRLVAK